MFLGDNIYNSLTPKMFTGDNRNQSPPNRVEVLVIESLAVNVLIVKVLKGSKFLRLKHILELNVNSFC